MRELSICANVNSAVVVRHVEFLTHRFNSIIEYSLIAKEILQSKTTGFSMISQCSSNTIEKGVVKQKQLLP